MKMARKHVLRSIGHQESRDELYKVKSALEYSPDVKGKRVKAFHTRYRVLGPELIPVYRQSCSPQVTISHPPGGRR